MLINITPQPLKPIAGYLVRLVVFILFQEDRQDKRPVYRNEN